MSSKTEDDEESIPRLALAAQWAQRSELIACLAELCNVIQDSNAADKRVQLSRQETHLEGSFLTDRTIGKNELVRSTRNLATLTTLYHSVVGIHSSTVCMIFPHRYRPDLVLKRA